MLRRLFGGTGSKAQSPYPSDLIDYYHWLQKLPQQEVIGEANSDKNNPVTIWFKYGHQRALGISIEHGKLHWYTSDPYESWTRDTEVWMGQILTRANNRKGKITAAMALEDCVQLMNELNAAYEQRQAALAVQQQQQNADELLQPPPLPGKKEKNSRDLRLTCWYCKKALPGNTPREVIDYTEERTGPDESSSAAVRVITFICPSCGRENQQQMDLHGQVTIRDTNQS